VAASAVGLLGGVDDAEVGADVQFGRGDQERLDGWAGRAAAGRGAGIVSGPG
jgi:hypothetical protein